MKCGITAENHFHCCDFTEWLILEIVVMAAFFAILALGILLHWLHPIHLWCDLWKPPIGPLFLAITTQSGYNEFAPCMATWGIPPPFIGPIPLWGRKK